MATNVLTNYIQFLIENYQKSGLKTKVSVASAVGLFVLYFSRKFSTWNRHSSLKKLISECKKARAKNFSDIEEKLQDGNKDHWKHIVSLNFNDLRAALQSEQLSPVEVLRAYQWKALQVTRELNCVCFFVIEAENEATKLQEQYSGAEKPPLYGIPVSIKESISVRGQIATRGYAQCLAERPSGNDADIVKMLRQLGAIPFCTTNVPQTLLSYTCSNPVYGTTRNPFNPRRTCGGSSGGEAALISGGGSILGFGGDVGGSIRMPCAFCGIAGVKPGKYRFLQNGSAGSIPGRPMVYSSGGPMARDVDTLVCAMQYVLTEKAFDMDPFLSPVPFNFDKYHATTPLKIGYYDYNKTFEAIPACRRAVAEVKQLLEQNGHTLVSFHPPQMPRLTELFSSACMIDGGQYLKSMLSRDIIDSSTELAYKAFSLPIWMRHAIGAIISIIWPRYGAFISAAPATTVKIRENYGEMEQIQQQVIKAWKANGIQAIIAPVNAGVAPLHATPPKALIAASYTYIYNVLNFPAGTVRCGTVTDEDDREMRKYSETDPMGRAIKEGCKNSKGLPIGIQCIALPHDEETCLRILKEIEIGVKIE